jgi:hypothetical protein
MGSIQNRFPSRPDAPARLQLSTEMGSIRVREGSFAADRRPRVAPPPPPARPATAAPDTRPSGPRNDPELERVLKMVESGEISAHDADELLQAMGRV